jgi:hypothetical protein
MHTHDVFTLLAASITAFLSLGLAANQCRTWARARRSRRLTTRLLEWD